jgi:hypothetical protein
MISKLFGLVLALVVVIILPIVAANTHASSKAVDKTLDGKLVCLGCDLKKSGGARTDCKTYGHDHVLKTEDGRYISFLENQYSTDLIKGEKYHNKDIVVQGKFHANANLMDVESFKVDGQKKTWCNHCKAMDGCESMKK